MLLGSDGATPTDTLGASTVIDWTVWEGPGGAQVESGPEGFVTEVSGSSSRARVEFSIDGRTWEPTRFDPAPPVHVGRVLATPDTWMLTSMESNGSLNAYLSADGRNWTRTEWPAELRGAVADVAASQLGFLALARSDSGFEMWTSHNGVEWEPFETPDVLSENSILAGAGEWVALGEWGGTTQSLAVSNDGRTWLTGELAVPPESPPALGRWMSIVKVGRIAEGWGAIAVVSSSGSSPGESRGFALHVWTSDDGSAWSWQGSPPFGENLSFAMSGTVVFARGLVFVGPLQSPDGSAQEIYVSADGVNWDVTHSIEIQVEDLAVRTLEDGSTAGVLVGVDSNSNG
jgi:hypothetical protein